MYNPCLFAHEIPNYTIKERTENANLVFEGEVIGTEAFWSIKPKQIFTKNFVAIKKLYKGEWSDSTIIVYTKGGILDGHLVLHHHDASLSLGFKGLFFGLTDPYRTLKAGEFEGVRLLYEAGGFIRYLDNLVGAKAIDGKKSFNDINIVHDSIMATTRLPVGMWENGILKITGPCEPDMESGLELAIGNAEIKATEFGLFLEFDVVGKVVPNGTLMGKAELSITYPEEVFGSKLVYNGLAEVTKEQVISSSAYNLTYSDSSANTLKIFIDTVGPSTAFYAMTAVVKEKICRVKIDITNVTDYSSLTPENFNFYGKAWYYCGGSLFPFEEIILEEDIKLINHYPESASSITYTFENLHRINNGSQLQIDIYASSSVPTSFAGGLIEFSFNTAAISLQPSSQGFGFARGEIIQNTGVYLNSLLTLQSFPPNVVIARVESTASQNLFLLDNNPHKMMSITLEIEDCNEQVGLSFNSSNMDGQSNHYTGIDPVPWEIYDPVISTDTENAKTCGCINNPDMVEFSPVIIHAGNREILTITGSGFGAYESATCKVEFENGDVGGGAFDKAVAENGDIIKWTDQEIKVFVPSTSNGDVLKKPACSGKVTVRNDCGFDDKAETNIANSDPELHIPYALLNRRLDPNKPGDLMTLADINGEGYIFQYGSNVNQFVKDAFEAALSEWCAETNIEFKVSNQVPIDDQGNNIFQGMVGDGYNTITQENIAGGIGGLAINSAYFVQCVNPSTGKRNWYMKELDIMVDPSLNTYQLVKDVMLHELGHAQMLQHSVRPNAPLGNDNYIMYYTLGNVTNGSIKQDDSDGANQVFVSSAAILDNSGCSSKIGQGNCGDIINSTNGKNILANIKVVPNPITQNVFQVFGIEQVNGPVTWQIQDMTGRNQINGKGLVDDNGTLNISFNDPLTSGAYFVSITSDFKIISLKIVIL